MHYATFAYVRERLVNDTWVAMDQSNAIEMTSVEVKLPDGMHVNLDVGRNWGIRDLREEVGFYLNSNENTKFTFGVVSRTTVGHMKKV